MTTLTFGEKVGRIEEAIVDLLFGGMDYVRIVSTYNGELGDRPRLVEALRTLKGDFPLVLVGYTGGPFEETVRTPAPNAPLDERHHGGIEIVSCSDDSRSQYKLVRDSKPLTRKDGQALSHRMFSDVIALLSNRQLTATVGGEQVILNEGELIPRSVDYIERLTGMTAVSTTFSLYFDYTSADNRAAPSGEIARVNFDITPERSPEPMNEPPGVYTPPRFRR
jgi:hypothetical protein